MTKLPLPPTAPTKSMISVEFSSVLFDTIPTSARSEWEVKYRSDYPSSRSTKAYSVELNHLIEPYKYTFISHCASMLGIAVPEPTIRLYVCPWLSGSISEPGIINPAKPAEDMLLTVLHECAHYMLIHNDAYDTRTKRIGPTLLSRWGQQWGELPFATLAHIPVFALLESFCGETPELARRLPQYRLRHAHYADYQASWNVLAAVGTRNVLAQTRSVYADCIATSDLEAA